MYRSDSKRQTAARSSTALIRSRVLRLKSGRIVGPADFDRLGSRAAVDQALSRLARSGVLRRITRGLYERPRIHPTLGPLLPSVDAAARALAKRNRWHLQVAGGYAANLLGLTDQVPVRTVYLTDGRSHVVRFGNQELVFRHTTPRNMATAGRISGLVIQALRYVKRSRVDARVVDRLRARFTRTDRSVLRRDASLAPAWIGEILRNLASDEA